MNTISPIFQWIVLHGYILMFIAMLIEGPVVTASGAFAAKLGYFNLYIVFLISILGNIIPDVVYYLIGYWGRTKIVDRFGKYFKLSHERVVRLESLMEHHAGKTLLAVKLLPLMAVPGLMAAGVTRMPFRKYITLSLAIIFPTSFLFLLVGYYAGAAYTTLISEINNAIYVVIGAFAVFFIVSYLWRRLGAKIAGKIEKI